MFGTLLNFGNQQQQNDWGDRLLSDVATQAIRHLFSASESVEVKLRCFPVQKLLQGSLDSLTMAGKGLVIRNQFRAESLKFQTSELALDFGAVLQGKIRMQKATTARAEVVLKEEDINKAFLAPLVTQHLENQFSPMLGKHRFSFRNVEVKLLADNRVQISTQVQRQDNLIPLAMTARLGVENQKKIRFEVESWEQFDLTPAQQELYPGLQNFFRDRLNNLVDLDRFNLDGVTMRIKQLETQDEKLLLSGSAQIFSFPNI